jgi:hypothetical protein
VPNASKLNILGEHLRLRLHLCIFGLSVISALKQCNVNSTRKPHSSSAMYRSTYARTTAWVPALRGRLHGDKLSRTTAKKQGRPQPYSQQKTSAAFSQQAWGRPNSNFQIQSDGPFRLSTRKVTTAATADDEAQSSRYCPRSKHQLKTLTCLV